MATATVEDSLNDIIRRLELKKQIQELIESIVLPLAMTMLMPHERIRKFPPGILLHGPPGTGKPVVTGKKWRRQAAYRRH